MLIAVGVFQDCWGLGDLLEYWGEMRDQVGERHRIIAVGDNEPGLQAFSAMGVKTIREEKSETWSVAPLPGMEAVTRSLLHAGIPPEEHVLYSSGANQALPVELLDQFFVVSQEKGMCVGVREVEDHPVQCHVHYDMSPAEWFCFQDPDFDSDSLTFSGAKGASFPFHVQWEQLHQPHAEQGRVYAVGCRYSDSGMYAEPVDRPEDCAEWCSLFELWSCENDRTGRVVLTRTCTPGHALSLGGNRLFEVWRTHGSLHVQTDMRLAGHPGSLLVWALSGANDAPCIEPDFRLTPDGKGKAVIDHVPPELTRIMCVYLLRRGGGSFAHSETLDLEQNLWTFDPTRNTAVNVDTGLPVIGRQDFPALYELGGGVCCGKLRHFLEFNTRLQDGKLIPIVLAPEIACAVLNDVERLRSRIVRKKKGEKKSTT